jgi:nitrogen fixation NifU-like protein
MDLEILKIASNTENHKAIKNYTHLSRNKNPVCGDVMEISLLIKNDLIEDIGYQCRSCIYCQASVSLLSRKIKNKKINQIKELINTVEEFFSDSQIKINKEWEVFKKILNTRNKSRKQCLLLPFKTIAKALKFNS